MIYSIKRGRSDYFMTIPAGQSATEAYRTNVKIHLKCPFCGSHRIKTVGGENGDPFNRSPEKTVCLDCGMTVNTGHGLEDLLGACTEAPADSEA